MTPKRMAKLVAWWVRFYTRDLATPIAQRRINEIDADLHDHIAHARAQGTSDRRIALSILSRLARGLTADASWRRRVRPLKGSPMKSLLAILAIAIAVAAIVLGGIDDAPGPQLLGVLLVVGVGSAWLSNDDAIRQPGERRRSKPQPSPASLELVALEVGSCRPASALWRAAAVRGEEEDALEGASSGRLQPAVLQPVGEQFRIAHGFDPGAVQRCSPAQHQ
jgi:hypothetical protein